MKFASKRLSLPITTFTTLVLLSACVVYSAEKQNAGWENKGNKIVNGSRSSVDHKQLVEISANLKKILGARVDSSYQLSLTSHLKNALSTLNPSSLSLAQALSKRNLPNDIKIKWREKNETPVFVSGNGLKKYSLTSAKSTAEAVLSFIDSNKVVFKLDSPSEELFVMEELIDKLGNRHIKFGQIYQGIKLWGHDLVAHFDTEGGLYFLNARYSPTPTEIDINAGRISQNRAVEIASENLSETVAIRQLSQNVKNLLDYDKPETELFIWINDNTQQPHLIWHVQIRPNIRDHWYYFIDAISGEILEKYNNTKTDGPAVAAATDLNGVVQTINTYLVGTLYYLIDGSRPMWVPGQTNIVNKPLGALWTQDFNHTDNGPWENVTSSNNTWSDPVSVSAHYNVGRTFEYFNTTFGRNAINDSGSTIISIIHATENGQSSGNAGWGAPIMYYGDGDSCFYPLAGALDVAAHEMTHGVIDYTVNLDYKFQTGALNESFADVFGAMVDRDNWLIGEDVVRASCFPSGALRNLADPHNGGTSLSDRGWQPAHMDEFLVLTFEQDNGGVHINSGIPNRAAYLIGSTIGKDKLEQIYYRILDVRYLNSQAQFVDMRIAAIRSATDLYTDPSNEVDVVRSAFDLVGIFDGPGTEPPPDILPVTGEEWVAVVNAEPNDNSLYRVSPDLVGPVIEQLTTTQVFNFTSCPITADREGTNIIFVDTSHFLRAIFTDGSGEAVISSTGEWWSVALSPDGTKLAATSIYVDSSMYIFDFENPDSSKVIHLYSPTTAEGVTSQTVLFADALEWNLTGEYVLYDAFNSIPQQGGGSVSYWDINIVEVRSEQIFRVMALPPEGVQIGNPSFASTNDIVFAFDILDANSGSNYVAAVNLFNVQLEVVESNGSSIGFPDYSPDDSKIVFQREVSGVKTLRQIDMNSDKITAIGSSISWLSEASLPNWFVIKASCCQGIRGDIDGNGTNADILDLTYMIDDIFRGGPASPCEEEADLDGNGIPSNVLDLTYLIDDIFRGGPDPVSCN